MLSSGAKTILCMLSSGAKTILCILSSSAKVLVRGEPNVSYICSRYYRAPELIFGATDYTVQIGKCLLLQYYLNIPQNNLMELQLYLHPVKC